MNNHLLRYLAIGALAALLGANVAGCAQPADNLAHVNDEPEAPGPDTEPTDKPPIDDIACQGDVNELADKAPSQTEKPEILGVCLGENLSVVFTFYKGGFAKDLEQGDVSATVAKLVPASGGESTHWQNYINKYEQPSSGAWPYTAKKLQATTENTGTLVELDKGVYAYTFTNPVTGITSPEPIKWEPKLTHRVGLEFRGDVLDPALGNPTYTWLPETGKAGDVTLTRDVVDLESCDSCHNGTLEMHGRARVDTQYCVLCHNSGTTDANSGNSMDLKVLVHKIHMGKALPSVKNGTPYKIWGNRNSLHDYSHVGFPQDQRNCIKCHDPADAKTPDAVNYLEKPTIEACGSCHDDVSFDPGTTTHKGGASNNGECALCHGPGKNFSADVSHTTAYVTAHNPNLPAGIPNVTYTLKDMYMVDGTMPVVTLGIFLDGQPLALKSVPTALTSTLWGYGTFNGKNILGMPSFLVAFSVTETTMVNFSSLGAKYGNLDFNNWFTTWDASATKHEGKSTSGSRVTYGQPQSIPLAQTKGAKAGYPNGATITNNLIDNGDGTYTTKPYMLLSVPANAKNVTVALQGYLGFDLNGNNSVSTDERIGADSKVVGVGVNDTPRRKVVDINNCVQCHERLSLHGGNRTNNPNLCVLCHNPAATDRGQRPGSPVDGLAEQSIDFGPMIHRIHRGEHQYSDMYVIYGYGGSVNDFKEVLFPGKLNQCTTCHLPGTYQLPVADGALAVSVLTGSDKSSPYDDTNISPTGAACTGCHDSPSAKAHAMVDAFYMSPLLRGTENDSCAVCHGPGEAYDVKNVHGVK